MVGQNLSFKLTIGLLALFFLEGMIKLIFEAFPLTEVLTAQGLAAGSWFTKRAFTDTKGFKYGNQTPKPD
jgi:hypothetical protein